MTSRLRITVGTAASTGAAVLGDTRYRLEFINVSGATCALSGYPEVAAYRDDGTQVGNVPPGHGGGTAGGPPGHPDARYIGHALKACSAAGLRAPVFLRVRAVQPGTGISAARQPSPARPPL